MSDNIGNSAVNSANNNIKSLIEIIISQRKRLDRGRCPYNLCKKVKLCENEDGTIAKNIECVECSEEFYVWLSESYYEKYKVKS